MSSTGRSQSVKSVRRTIWLALRVRSTYPRSVRIWERSRRNRITNGLTARRLPSADERLVPVVQHALAVDGGADRPLAPARLQQRRERTLPQLGVELHGAQHPARGERLPGGAVVAGEPHGARRGGELVLVRGLDLELVRQSREQRIR